MDRVEMARTLAELPQKELVLLLGIADLIRNGEPKVTFEAPVKRKPGRPKGSKNKPKVVPVPGATLENSVPPTTDVTTDLPPVPADYMGV